MPAKHKVAFENKLQIDLQNVANCVQPIASAKLVNSNYVCQTPNHNSGNLSNFTSAGRGSNTASTQNHSGKVQHQAPVSTRKSYEQPLKSVAANGNVQQQAFRPTTSSSSNNNAFYGSENYYILSSSSSNNPFKPTSQNQLNKSAELIFRKGAQVSNAP